MSDTQKHSEETLFSQALEYSGSEREAYLDRVCDGDPQLRKRIVTLLKAQPQLGGFMEQPSDLTDTNEGQSLSTTWCSEPSEGDTIGRYKLLQKIGEGGCGIVYMADQVQPVQRRVALKIIKLGMDTKAVLARFEAERQALAMMDHPNIAKVFDAGRTDSGRPYFVMELVRGIRITDFCNQNRLTTRDRLELVVQVCHAVQHAHQKGIVHRDLKPSNILVTVDAPGAHGLVKIIDFGIAKAVQGRLTDQTLFTALEQLLGTPAYMSPEQTMMTTMDVDTRSDIYSMGVLLYELLTGTTPFPTKELLEAGLNGMRQTLQEKQPPLPSTRLSSLLASQQVSAATFRQADSPKLINLVKGDLDWIVMKCLEKDRSRRYGAASALAADLRRHLNDEPVDARPPSRWYRFQKSVRRHRLGYAAGLVALLSLAIGSGVSLWQAKRAKRAEQSQRRLAYNSDMNLAQSALMDGDLGQARLFLRRYVPIQGEADLRNWEWRYLADQCQGDELYSLPGHDGPITTVRYLDPETLMTTGLQDLQTKIWSLKEQRLLGSITNKDHGGGIRLLTLSSDQRQVYFTAAWRPSPHVWALDLETGSDRRLTTMDSPVLSLAMDRQRNVLAIGSANRVELRSLNEDDPTLRTVQTEGQAAALAFSAVRPQLAIVDSEGAVLLYHLDSGEELRIPRLPSTSMGVGNEQPIDADWWCHFTPDGRSIAFGNGSRLVQICDIEQRTIRAAFEDSDAIIDASFSADGKILATVGANAVIRLRATSSWVSLHGLRGHTDPVRALTFAPSGNSLATASRNGEIKIWSTERRHLSPERIALPPALIFGALKDGSAYWRVLDLKQEATPKGWGYRIPGVEIWSSNPLKLSGSINLQDLLIAPKETYDFTSQGSTLCINGVDERVHLRKLGHTADVAATKDPDKDMNRVRVSLDGSYMVTLDYYNDWRIQVWSIPKMKVLAERRDIPDVHEVHLSEDGTSLAILTGTGKLGILRMPTLEGDKPWKAAGSATRWTGVSFSPDNRLLATAVGTGQATLWNLETHEALELPRSSTEYTSLSFSSDGSRLAASDARSMRIFETQSGLRVMEMPLAGALVAFRRPDDTLLAVGRDYAQLFPAPSIQPRSLDWLKEAIKMTRPNRSHHE